MGTPCWSYPWFNFPPELPGFLQFLYSSDSFFFIFLKFIAIMCRRISFLKVIPPYWEQNSYWVWKGRERHGEESAWGFLLVNLTSTWVKGFFDIPGVRSYILHDFPFQFQNPKLTSDCGLTKSSDFFFHGTGSEGTKLEGERAIGEGKQPAPFCEHFLLI